MMSFTAVEVVSQPCYFFFFQYKKEMRLGQNAGTIKNVYDTN